MYQGDENGFSHAAEALELPAVLEMVAAGCRNESARAKLKGSKPDVDPERIAGCMDDIDDMRRYLAAEGELPIASTELRDVLRDAGRPGAVLAGKVLRRIAANEKLVMKLKRTFARAKEYPKLERMAALFEAHRGLVDEIEKALGEEGEVLSGASRALREVRRRIESTKEELRKRVERASAHFGENAYGTILDGRFVLLVPAGKTGGKGIVHGKSKSGGSVYFEPMAIVDLNNRLGTLIEDEREEELRILSRLTSSVAEHIDAILANLDLMDELDVLEAKAKFADEYACSRPAIADKPGLRVVKARHPLLVRSIGRENVVPLDIRLEEAERILVITGPNAGGKTVALKTVGLLVLMHQCGLQVPCSEGTELPLYRKVMVDIGDEQSIANSLSTFTSRLRNLDRMCRHADRDTLCLIDEIGDGTDPEEGAALANAVLTRLLSNGTTAIATTHYGKVKTFALMTEGIKNGSMLFDESSQEPLYVFLQGIAGRSRGLETARRCRFDEEVLETASRFLDSGTYRLENLLSDLESAHLELEEERKRLRERSAKLQEVISLYLEREKSLSEMQAEHGRRAAREAEELLSSARSEIERVVKEIRETAAEKEAVKRARESMQRLAGKISSQAPPPPPAKRLLGEGDVSVGEVVALSSSGAPSGRILEIENGRATIEIKGKRIKINIGSLFKLPAESRQGIDKVEVDVEFEPLGSTSIDVRGQEREEALEAVDRFVDRAVLSGVHEIMIIHGVGEGILKDAVRRQLHDDPRVLSIRAGRGEEGGAGVSIVRLA